MQNTLNFPFFSYNKFHLRYLILLIKPLSDPEPIYQLFHCTNDDCHASGHRSNQGNESIKGGQDIKFILSFLHCKCCSCSATSFGWKEKEISMAGPTITFQLNDILLSAIILCFCFRSSFFPARSERLLPQKQQAQEYDKESLELEKGKITKSFRVHLFTWPTRRMEDESLWVAFTRTNSLFNCQSLIRIDLTWRKDPTSVRLWRLKPPKLIIKSIRKGSSLGLTQIPS